MAETGGPLTRESFATAGPEPRVDRLAEAPPLDLVPTLDPEVTTLLHAAEVETPRRDKRRRRALAAADLCALVLAFLTMRLVAPPDNPLLSTAPYLGTLPLWVVLNKVLGLYDRDAHAIHASTLDELPTLVQSLALGTGVIFFFSPVFPGVHAYRPQTLVFFVIAVLFTVTFRHTARRVLARTLTPERCLIVGSGSVAGLVARKVGGHPEFGAELLGYVDAPEDPPGLPGGGIRRLGNVSGFEEICRAYDVERVIIAFSSLSHERLLDVIRMAKRLHLKISIVPRLFEVIGHNVEIDQVEGMTLLGLRPLMRTRSTRALKRAIDIAGAAVGLLALAPLLAVVALAVRLGSPGPVLFSQPRVGRGNEVFRMLKFRTMVVEAESLKPALAERNEMAGGRMFKMRDDPRVTRVGRFLRRASLDELPQLWNVLRGEMSLVGPRPLVPDEDGHVLGWHRARLDLMPGLTGPWQVMGRNQIPFDEMVKLDYLYVTEWSLWNDLKLILRTLPVMLRRQGA
jgi:exopolysaccharide biosynthesis polyprenyl glycosylphosphotransferase